MISISAAVAMMDGLMYRLSLFNVTDNDDEDSAVTAPALQPVSISLDMKLVAKIDMMY